MRVPSTPSLTVSVLPFLLLRITSGVSLVEVDWDVSSGYHISSPIGESSVPDPRFLDSRDDEGVGLPSGNLSHSLTFFDYSPEFPLTLLGPVTGPSGRGRLTDVSPTFPETPVHTLPYPRLLNHRHMCPGCLTCLLSRKIFWNLFVHVRNPSDSKKW